MMDCLSIRYGHVGDPRKTKRPLEHIRRIHEYESLLARDNFQAERNVIFLSEMKNNKCIATSRFFNTLYAYANKKSRIFY